VTADLKPDSADVSQPTSGDPAHREALVAAVRAIGGTARSGQAEMADAVADAFDTGTHLLVQAGTGTGKSLGYLVPALSWLTQHPGERIVVATATLALQSQLADKDIPVALDAVEQVTGQRPVHAVLKGRTNYACLLRVRDATTAHQETLLSAADLAATMPSRAPSSAPESVLGAEVLGLREWAEGQATTDALADRDSAPPHTERGWQQVSIPVRECLGAQRCPYGDACFVEKSRDAARAADLIVTNHALLAINAMHGSTALPTHRALIIDEAHELVARVTGAASAELSPQLVERIGRRVLPYVDDDVALELLESADGLRQSLDRSSLERVEDTESGVVVACEAVRNAARAGISALTSTDDKDFEKRQVAAAVKEVFDLAERMAEMRDHDVIWVADRERSGRELRVAPLSVSVLMRDHIFADRTAVLTSATLRLGGEFTTIATSVGLRTDERTEAVQGDIAADTASNKRQPWRAIDVGSPFDYRRQGILYLARSLPPPGRDGLSKSYLEEIAELVWAAGGRTLGLFSSRRAAEAAAVHVRKQLPKLTILCQGDAQLSELTRRFVEDETVSLFGTLSLWQGVDVPGATCSLVIIDRIPFPRPDEPLTLARQRAVAEAGGNGFLAVAATHAALLLAQGSGRLIRRLSDRGVVAVLDPRLITARYGSYLRASMPEMWQTSEREVVIAALRRLSGQA
jgi:ATP-dependent DNA helicase DinG